MSDDQILRDALSSLPEPPGLDPKRALSGALRRRTRHRLAVGGSVVAGFAALTGIAVLLLPGGRAAEPVAPPQTTATSMTPSHATPAPSTHPSSPVASATAGMTRAPLADYRDRAYPGTRYVFTSPSGHLRCALAGDASAGNLTGCQSTEVVAGTPSCGAQPEQRATMVYLGTDKAVRTCTTQGVFVAEKAVVLPYGATLTVRGVTCTSGTDGVTCVRASDGAGFRIAREGVTLQ